MNREFGTIDKRPNGRYRARYIHPEQPHTDKGARNRISAPTTFLKKSEARAWLDAIEVEILRGQWRSPEQIAAEKERARREQALSKKTFGEYARSWLDSRRLKNSTRRSYEINLDTHILPHWSNSALQEITTAEVREWLSQVAPGRPGARKKSYELFKTILNGAVEEELITSNPCKRNMLKTTRAADKKVKPARTHEPRALTETELVNLADEVPAYMRLPVLLSGLVGLRMGEVRALRGRHVIEESGVLFLNIRENVTGVGGSVSFHTPKSRKSLRTVKVPSSLAREVGAAAEVAGLAGLLFHPDGDSSRPIPDQTYRNNIANAGKRARIGHVAPHDLRHTAASIMQNHGVPDHVVADLLGHETTKITRIYTHSHRQVQADAVDTIDRVVMGQPAGVSDLDERRATGS